MELTDKQKAWVQKYKDNTMFDVLYIEEYESGAIGWREFMRKNIDWFEAWANDAQHQAEEYKWDEGELTDKQKMTEYSFEYVLATIRASGCDVDDDKALDFVRDEVLTGVSNDMFEDVVDFLRSEKERLAN